MFNQKLTKQMATKTTPARHVPCASLLVTALSDERSLTKVEKGSDPNSSELLLAIYTS